jgi:hypothetical protein
MNHEAIIDLGAVASNSSTELSKRIAATAQLGYAVETSATASLKGLLGKKIDASGGSVNWDPSAAQRVVELHAIAALHRRGDDSELGRIPPLVSAAGRVLQGPNDERRNAATVIAAVGSVTVIRDLVMALDKLSGRAANNIVEVLDTLFLPEAPVRQSLENFAGAHVEVTGVSASLQDFMNLVISAAKRSVHISQGVEEMIALGSSPMGKTESQKAKMQFLLQSFLPGFGLDYYTVGRRAMICTFAESADRWREWLARYGDRLDHSPITRTFVLRDP